MNNNKASKLKEKSKNSFDKSAESYDRTFGKLSRPLYREVLKKLEKAKFEKLLDIGFGTGTVLKELSQRKPNSKLFGIDISPEMVKTAEKKIGSQVVELLTGDSDNLPWDDYFFDTIITTNVFHHFPEPVKTAKEIYRTLKPGGLLLIGDIWLPTPFRQVANLLLPLSPQGDVRIYSKGEMSDILAESGFKDIKWDCINIAEAITTAKKATT